MTELQHMMLGCSLAAIFNQIFLRQYFLKQYREIKRLKNKKQPVGSERPDVMSFDEYMEKREN